MRHSLLFITLISFVLFVNCSGNNEKQDVFVIGFLDAVEDATLSLARDGFVQALADENWSEEDGNLKIIFRNFTGIF